MEEADDETQREAARQAEHEGAHGDHYSRNESMNSTQQTDDNDAFAAEGVTQTTPDDGSGDLPHKEGGCQQTHIGSDVLVLDLG